MSLAVFGAVMAAALLHAFWNALIKVGGNKVTAMLMLSLGNAAIGAAYAAFRPLPPADIWPWLLVSGLIHTAYQFCLAQAYEHGDLSRVYPISRGTAPLIVLIAGGFFLPDELAPAEAAGIVILGAGIIAMARGVTRDGESARLLPYALGAALATAAYSIVDGSGARLLGDAPTYVAWTLVVGVIFFLPVAFLMRGREVLRAGPRGYGLGLLGGAASFAAYSIAVWAMTQAPIALVTALRETSILFAVLIGWLIFKERMSRRKALAAVLIVGGVALTRL